MKLEFIESRREHFDLRITKTAVFLAITIANKHSLLDKKVKFAIDKEEKKPISIYLKITDSLKPEYGSVEVKKKKSGIVIYDSSIFPMFNCKGVSIGFNFSGTVRDKETLYYKFQLVEEAK
jgi:hypothetical protein